MSTSQIAQVKDSQRLPGTDEILVPGERGQRRRRTLLEQGTVPLVVRSVDDAPASRHPDDCYPRAHALRSEPGSPAIAHR